MENPYSLVFGKMPKNFIERDNEINEIISTFTEAEPSIRSYILTGLRGCGKTVTLSGIEKELRGNKDFYVLSLNSDLDLLSSAYEELEQLANKHNIFSRAEVSMSEFGVSVGIKEQRKSAGLQIDNLLQKTTKKNKRVIFCIDEVSNTQNIKSFCQAFNIWLRKDYDVLILMTGLKKNILSLQGDDRVSFLKRSERIELQGLSLNSIADNYKNNLDISEHEAAEMARFTSGYSYAFQLLGYLCFKNKVHYKDVLHEFDSKLADNVYDIIWEDLTAKEKEVTEIIANSDLTTEGILTDDRINKNTYNQYRRILISKGLLKDKGYGKIEFTLPRFAEILKHQRELGMWVL